MGSSDSITMPGAHMSPEMQQHMQQSAARAEMSRQKEAARAASSWLRFVPLVPLPPVNAVPFEWLLEHEYVSFALWFFRAFVCRPTWHLLLWWHAVCAVGCIIMLLRWRCSSAQRTQVAAGVHSADSTVPPLALFFAHCCFWALQAALFGWPAIYVLRQQLDSKPKQT